MNTLKRYKLISTYRYEITCPEIDLIFKLEIYQSEQLFKGIVFCTDFYALTPVFPPEHSKHKIAHEEIEIRDHFFDEQELTACNEQQVIKQFEEKIADQFMINTRCTSSKLI